MTPALYVKFWNRGQYAEGPMYGPFARIDFTDCGLTGDRGHTVVGGTKTAQIALLGSSGWDITGYSFTFTDMTVLPGGSKDTPPTA